MPLADRGRMGGVKSNVPDKSVGVSNIPNLFLSVVEINAGPPTPMLATSFSTMACYLCSLGVYDKYHTAKEALSRAHKEIKGMMETEPTSEHSTTFKAGKC